MHNFFFSPRVLYPPQRASFMENEMAPNYTYRGETSRTTSSTVQLSKAFWAPKPTQTKLICASAELVRPPANCAARSYYAETRQAPQPKYV